MCMCMPCRLSFLVVSIIFGPLFFLSFGVPAEVLKQYTPVVSKAENEESTGSGSGSRSGVHASLLHN
jgi:hypothetical protein